MSRRGIVPPLMMAALAAWSGDASAQAVPPADAAPQQPGYPPPPAPPGVGHPYPPPGYPPPGPPPPGYPPPGYPPPGYSYPPPPHGHPMAPGSTGDDGPYSPGVALGLAFGTTFGTLAVGFTMLGAAFAEDSGPLLAAGIGTVSAGAVFGPSVGLWYAGEGGRGALSMGLRLLAFGGSVGLGFAGIASAFGNDDGAAFALVMVGGMLGSGGLGLMVWDLAETAEAARRANREARAYHAGDGWIPELTLGGHGIGPEWRF